MALLKTLNIITVAVVAILLSASHVHAQDGQDNRTVTTMIYKAIYNSTTLPDLDSLDWVDITNNPSAEKRICDPCDHCNMVKTVTVTTDSGGDWWSDWCRVDGLSTHNKGDAISIASVKMKSTTMSAEISISAPMSSSLTAKVGYQVTNSLGWAQSIGCYNWDGITHGLWLQEHIGWAWQTITSEFSQSGPSWCPSAPATDKRSVQINWPDPNHTGFR